MYIEFEKGQKFAKSINNDISDNLDAFDDAGWLLEDDDLVIDIDKLPKESINALIATFGIKTQYVLTERGIHLYYRKPMNFRGAMTVSMLGVPIEYKHKANTRAVTIKRNGIAREVFNKGVRESLPDIFRKHKGFNDIVGLSSGEGRNDALYKHKMALKNCKGWQSILKFVNWHVFADPLDNEEFESVARSEAVISGEKGNEIEIARYLVNQIDYLNYYNRYYFKDENGDYISDDNQVMKFIIDYYPDSKSGQQDEILKQMQRRCRVVDKDTVFKIKFNNGYLFNGKFYEIEYKDFTPYTINIDYKVDAPSVEIVDKYLGHLTKNDEDYRRLLLEVLGHTLIVNPEFKRLLAKFFIFVGGGGNGKGTLLQIIKNILNNKNCTAMDIGELADERYLVTFKGKLANLGDDISDGVISDKYMKVLKNITTCDDIAIRELYKQSEVGVFTGSLIFTSNHILKSFEKGKSYKRRVMWLPMYTEVKEEDKDPLFISKMTSKESLEYWIRLIIEGYMRLYENNKFSDSKIVNKFNADYHEENNPYLMYLSDLTKDDFIDKPIKDSYDRCKEWCADNEIEFSQAMFRTTVKEVFNLDTNGMKRVNGKVTKVFKENN